ncbi:MAG: quinone oxidoreductase [Rhodospirillales bacterium]|jgi:NADPH2:quinone reductase|nr:quinone oxidoreductase [Rhodospirillales bacterium]
MAKAIRIHEHGGPEVLRIEDVDVGRPGPDEVRVRQTAIGLNYIDVYFRTGLYPVAELPTMIGLEGAGVIEEVGPNVTGLDVGRRIAYASRPIGAYADERLIAAESVVPLPDAIDDRTAAAMMLKGMTAHYLLHACHAVAPGDTILVHAAAGGVGLILCQWGKHLGAEVIGTVGSDEKADIARAHGCDHVIVYARENFAARVREITDGAGVGVVYDSVGKATFEGSLDCLRPRGMMVSFGNASGKTDPVDLLALGARGSLFLTRPSLMNYTETRDELVERASGLFAAVEAGHVKITVNQIYPLSDAARAHADLEARATTGSTVLIP